jgi:predicted Zn-dependent peptidase
LITKHKLQNGITCLFHKSIGSASVSIGLWVKIGSRDENNLERGYTHFLEHMVFKGTEKRTAKELALEIERVGGYMNAATTREYTYFYITIMKSKLELGLDILSDMVFHPLLKEHDIQNESSVILEELKSYEDDPDELLHDFYYKKFMKGSTLGLEIIGNRKSISSVTSESITSYYNKYYTPERMILSIAGDYEFEQISELVERYYSGFQKKFNPTPKDKKITKVKEKYHIKKKLEQVNFVLGTDGFGKEIYTNAKIGLFNIIWGSGMASRLFQSIREDKGLCYSINSYSSSYRDSGIFTISCGTSQDKFSYCLQSIYDEIKKLLDSGITDQELDDAKNNHKGSMAISYELPESKMNDMALQEIYFGKFYTLEDRMNILDSISKEELESLIQKLYSDQKLHLSAIGHFSKDEFSKISNQFQ